MSFLSQSVGIVKGGLALAGFVGVIALAASPASAENASISGAATRTTPGGYSASLSGEMVAPEGTYFSSPLMVDAVYDPNLQVPTRLTLTGGDLTTSPVPLNPDTLKAAVIMKLNGITGTTQTEIDAYSAILKAASGADGLE